MDDSQGSEDRGGYLVSVDAETQYCYSILSVMEWALLVALRKNTMMGEKCHSYAELQRVLELTSQVHYQAWMKLTCCYPGE